MKFDSFKEPKGFIRILEVVFCIISFAVLVSYSSTMDFEVKCNSALPLNGTSTFPATSTVAPDASTIFSTDISVNTIGPNTTSSSSTSDISSTNTPVNTTTGPKTTSSSPISAPSTESPVTILYTITISYPFKLASASSTAASCDGEDTSLQLEDKSSSKAIFFVFVGVTSFIVAFAMIIIYIVQDDLLASVEVFPTVDFAVTVVLTIFWFCGSIAWAAGAANLGVSTDVQNIIDNNMDLCYNNECSSPSGQPSFGGPIAAAVFGFVNLILFGANSWFTFKETSFHSSSG